MKSLSRRDFLKMVGVTAGAAALAGCNPAAPAAPGQDAKSFYFGTVIRTLSNEYHAAWYRGGRLFAESVGFGGGHRGLHCEGDSEKQITLMRALISESGGNVVFNVDPNQSPDARAIADLCAENKVYFLTQWNKPDDLHPWDYDPYWVAHMGVDGVPSGYYVAKELFERMGGQGKIVALQGLLANVPAIQRFDGLKKALAEYPGIELLEDQTAEWDRTKAVGVTEAFLAKYPEVGGIWAANDNMGLGALEALRTAGKAIDIPVVGIDGTSEAINACITGEFAATVNNDPMWQGGMGISIPYAAKMGYFDPTKEDKGHREFYFTPVFVNTANSKEIKENYIDGIPTYDWKDYWGRVQA
jgi:ribose transport system substrate-binding protein